MTGILTDFFTQQQVAKTKVNYIVLLLCCQVLLTFNVKPLSFIKYETLVEF